MDAIQCSIYDEKSGVYGNLFSAPSVPHAKRTFSDFVNDSGTIIGMHPADFTLFKIGVFDIQSGNFVVLRDVLGNGVEFIVQAGPVAVSG